MAALNDTVMQSSQTINAAVGATSAQTAAITSWRTFSIIRIAVTEATYIEIGANPTATATDSSYFPAGHVEYRKINEGDKVAYIRSSTDGRITIDLMV